MNDSLRVAREAALKGLEARLAADPNAVALRFERARLCGELGRPGDAQAGFEDVLVHDPMHFDALNDLATLLYKTGKRRDARAAYVQLIARHPANRR